MSKQPLDLEDQLHLWAEDLAARIPATEPAEVRGPVDRRPQLSGSHRRVLVAAAISVVLAASATAWRVTDSARDRVVAGPPPSSPGDAAGARTTQYERVQYAQEAELTCTGPLLARAGAFNQMTIETWGDPTTKTWRNRFTYPDGSTRDLIVLGLPGPSSEAFGRGDVRGDVLGCPIDGRDDRILVTEPGQGSLYSLNHPATREKTASATPAGPGQLDLGALVPGQHLSYADLGTLVPGEHLDSRGRPAQLWRQDIPGFAELSGPRRRLLQRTQWFVDPGTGRVLERTFSNQVETVGTARSIATVVESGSVTVPAKFFDRDGYSPWE